MKFNLTSICKKLGEANLPVYTVAAVAVFKGILRPAFTMMDKKQDPDTKKYAAIKEGATELTAIPTYIGLSWLTSKLAPAFSPHGKTPDALLHSSRSTLGFFGVCFAALYAIPKLCNVVMPHMMKALKGNKSEKAKPEVSQPQVVSAPVTPPQTLTSIQSPYAKNLLNVNGGMRV